MAKGVVDSYCTGCIHLKGTGGALDCGPRFCDYLNDEGHIRPCPAGKGCTEYESKED